VGGNRVRLQFDGPATFDRWLEAIGAARRFVHFENYILRDDRVGRSFRDALVAKAREGVPVRVLYDWVGCWATPRRYWVPFREAGVQVRAFNPPRLRDPWGVLQRDHRKLVCVDGDVAFVGGFCVGVEWAGDGLQPPWRDTGVEILGPAATRAAQAFERIWDAAGEPVPELHRAVVADAPDVGGTPVWIIQGEPGRSRVYRTLQLTAALAEERLWITDPYFVAPRPVSESLAAAAAHGVDVRILVPSHNNWPLVGTLSRAGYRFLLESGVRLFEWQGAMIHAKTAVMDGWWGRVGSSNINSASLLGNWEIDVGVADEALAGQLEGLFLADLASSVEIVLPGRMPVRGRVRGEVDTPVSPLDPEGTLPERLTREFRSESMGGGSFRFSDVVRAGSLFGDALAGHRPLGREDRTVLGTVAVLILPLAVLAAIFPRVAGWVLAVLLAWFGGTAGVRAALEARRARRSHHLEGQPDPGTTPTTPESEDDKHHG
jgi:cardiolipin synthase